MIRRTFFISALTGLLLMSCTSKDNNDMNAVIEKGLNRSAQQAKFLASSLLEEPDKLPRYVLPDGTLVTSDSHWWCSGFFSGVLWQLYEDTGDALLKEYAENYTKRIEKEQYSLDTHDLGFMMYCSYGQAFRITGEAYYKKVLLQSAKSLATRFNPNLGVIKSWDEKPKWKFPVIIDNMMNLELLEEVYKMTGDTLFDKISNSHAKVTMVNHFRPDYSSYHVVDYDTVNNKVAKFDTHQGYSSSSAWARGQAWGLYGYTMMYRETKNKSYLEHAEKIAKFILNHPNLPEDKVPYWDFNAPNIPNTYRDASSAAIMASALIELSQYVDKGLAKEYLSVARKQLQTLTSDAYLAALGSNGGFILKHSVGNFNENREMDVPLTYADYYYVEALLRYKHLVR
ncbi:glycoside hydrolase family 88 protein [Niabella sp.]|uniref:glycoside hydrolase family 88 protein n=1 Tax=Niabella sp. TaxID=1962976 RepID=UPI002635B3C1|nr:glycoside hydrolase family 88 protein [Niabella sp.]